MSEYFETIYLIFFVFSISDEVEQNAEDQIAAEVFSSLELQPDVLRDLITGKGNYSLTKHESCIQSFNSK